MNNQYTKEVLKEIEKKGYKIVYDDTFNLYEIHSSEKVVIMAFTPDDTVSTFPVKTSDGEMKFRGIEPAEVADYFHNRYS